jgi:hypothetical protein
VAADRPLTVAEVRLLGRIHRGEDVRRVLSKRDRELVLPALLRRGLAVDHGDGPVLTPRVAASPRRLHRRNGRQPGSDVRL